MQTFLVFLPDFSGGGAEKAYSRFIAHWPRPDDRFIVVVRRDSGALKREFYGLADDVICVGSSHRSSLVASIQSAVKLAGVVRRLHPDWVLGILSPLTAAVGYRLGGVGRGTRLGLAVQNPIAREAGLPRFARPLVGWAYRSADVVLPSALGLVEEIVEMDVPRTRVVLVPNPVERPRFQGVPRAALGAGKTVITVARLHPQKRLDIALRAIAKLDDPSVRYILLGEGSLRPKLEALVEGLGLQNVVSMPGYVDDPGPWLLASDVFLLTSDFEGFGNVIVEALAHGLPVVSTDAPYGPRDIIGDQSALGTLVPVRDIDSVAAAVRQWLEADRDLGREKRLARAKSYEANYLAGRLASALT